MIVPMSHETLKLNISYNHQQHLVKMDRDIIKKYITILLIYVFSGFVFLWLMITIICKRTEMKTKNKTSKVALIMIPITGRCYNYGGLKRSCFYRYLITHSISHISYIDTSKNDLEHRSSISYIEFDLEHKDCT